MAEVWPYVPLSDMEERLSWLTAVHPREDDTSRWSLRQARQELVYSYAFEQVEWETAKALWVSNVLGVWRVPCWAEATRDVAVSSSDTVLTVSTYAEYFAGGLAIVWGGCDTYTVVTVDSVGDGEITLTAPVGTDYAAAVVMPLRNCICRGGMQTTRRKGDTYGATIVFEATDNPDLTQLFEPLQIQIALDVTGSMFENDAAPDVLFWDAALSNTISLLRLLEASGQAVDIRLVLWESTAYDIERADCDAADFADIIAFAAAPPVAVGGTKFPQAFDGASTFFSGSRRRIFAFITDGAPTPGPGTAQDVTDAAIALRNAISNLECYALHIGDLATPFYTNQVSNQGDAQVVNAGGVALRDGIVLGLLGLPAYQGELFFSCAGAVIAPASGRIARAAVFVDSGFGPVSVEPERSYVEEANVLSVAENTMAGRWALKQKLHFLRGQDRPFRFAEKVIRIISATTTTITIAPVRAAASEWVGEEIEVGGFFREVTSATTSSGNHVLTVDALSSAPSGVIRVLQRVRLAGDSIALKHSRLGGWTRADIPVVTP